MELGVRAESAAQAELATVPRSYLPAAGPVIGGNTTRNIGEVRHIRIAQLRTGSAAQRVVILLPTVRRVHGNSLRDRVAISAAIAQAEEG